MGKKERKPFTYILVASRLLVFAAFLYVSMVMINIGRTTEGIIILFAVSLWLILNRLDKVV